MLKPIFRNLLIVSIILKALSFSQNMEYVAVQNGNFYLGGNKFFPLGTNAYYLHKYAACGDTNSINSLFAEMRNLGMNCVRTWAFSEGNNPNDIFTLHYSPYGYNDESFKKLDYVIYTAGKYNLKVILSLVNNWDDFGGMSQYLKWFSSGLHKESADSFQAKKVFSNTGVAEFYSEKVSEKLTHDDFFRIDTIKKWYKSYVGYLLKRINSFSRISYLNDKTIMAFELANEPESSDKSGKLIYDWISEMAEHFKSIDKNHLLGTGESGFDINNNGYGKYPSWLINGEKGVSFRLNSTIKEIDFTSVHLYFEAWDKLNGAEWIFDHNNFSKSINKPLLLGEYGSTKDRNIQFNSWLRAIKETRTGGALLWQLVPINFKDDDGYTLKQGINDGELNILKQNYDLIRNFSSGNIAQDIFSNPFPNPASKELYIRFSLKERSIIKYSIYNLLGEVLSYAEKDFTEGDNSFLVNVEDLASGIYFIKIETAKTIEIKKVAVVR